MGLFCALTLTSFILNVCQGCFVISLFFFPCLSLLIPLSFSSKCNVSQFGTRIKKKISSHVVKQYQRKWETDCLLSGALCYGVCGK